MIARRGPILLVIAVLLGGYGFRAYTGARAGWALHRGHLLRNMGDYEASAPLLEAAAVGFNRTRALLMAGRVRLDQWEKQVRRRGAIGADAEHLLAAGRDFLSCRCHAPAARVAWKGLGEVYDAQEWIERERRADRPWAPPADPWQAVGRPGRVALGMLRMTLDVSPNWGRLYDKLALTLWNYGLYDETRAAVRQSARVLPIFYRHPYHRIDELPDWVAREFAAGSREALGQAPLFPRSAHLIDLGKLERRLGENQRAIAALEEALESGGDRLRVAEASFHLGLALIEEEEFDRGQRQMETALEHPAFRTSALRSLADLSTRRGEDAEALDYLRRLRWEVPLALRPCLEFAAVAARLEDWPAAQEALRWAKLNHPEDVRPYRQLARVQLAKGNPLGAGAVADELEGVLGPGSDEVASLRREIARAAAGH